MQKLIARFEPPIHTIERARLQYEFCFDRAFLSSVFHPPYYQENLTLKIDGAQLSDLKGSLTPGQYAEAERVLSFPPIKLYRGLSRRESVIVDQLAHTNGIVPVISWNATSVLEAAADFACFRYKTNIVIEFGQNRFFEKKGEYYVVTAPHALRIDRIFEIEPETFRKRTLFTQVND